MKRTASLLVILVLGTMVAASPGAHGLSAADAQAQDPAANQPMPSPASIAQAEDGTILLHARDVTIHGTTVRYEPQPHKNTIGFWTKQDDWVSWTFAVAKPGTFAVEILQGCGKDSGGAEVALSIAEQAVTFTVEDTGHFQNFVKRSVGKVVITEPGVVTLTVKPKSKPGVAVMDLRQVLLTPVK
jgi:arylsulfatase A